MVNQIQKQFEQQVRNLAGDQFVQHRNINEDLSAVNKNNLLLASTVYDNYSLTSNNKYNNDNNISKIAVNNLSNSTKNSSSNKELAKNSPKNLVGAKESLANNKIEVKNDVQISNNNLQNNQEKNSPNQITSNDDKNSNKQVSSNENIDTQYSDTDILIRMLSLTKTVTLKITRSKVMKMKIIAT